MKVALVYDRINKFGGAERVLQALHAIWPQAPLYTSVYHPLKAPWADGWDIRPSFLDRVPFLRDKHEYLAPLMPYAFESFDLGSFDLVISVTSAEAKGIITKPHQLHLCYLLTPTRYLWSHTHHYRGRGITAACRLPFISSLRRWDYLAAQRPDHLIAISHYVKARIEKFYHRPVTSVIHPPVDYRLFSTPPAKCRQLPHPYFLAVSRLVSYKSFDRLVRLFAAFPRRQLLIVGTGARLSALSRLAPANVTFLGHLPDAKLICLYHHAQALILPQEEDFGIVSLEAQAAGTPVISLKSSGAAETIIPQKTGILFDRLDRPCLQAAFDALTATTWYHKPIRQNARKFAIDRFKSKFTKCVEELWHQHQTNK